MTVYTIGFTKKNAQRFFNLLRGSTTKRLLDVRLNNVSQLAGFAKRDDLKFFLSEICDIDYLHLPLLAPTQEMLDEYKKGVGDWDLYEAALPRSHGDSVDRGRAVAWRRRGELPALQRRQARPLPPPPGCGVPA